MSLLIQRTKSYNRTSSLLFPFIGKGKKCKQYCKLQFVSLRYMNTVHRNNLHYQSGNDQTVVPLCSTEVVKTNFYEVNHSLIQPTTKVENPRCLNVSISLHNTHAWIWFEYKECRLFYITQVWVHKNRKMNLIKYCLCVDIDFTAIAQMYTF